MSSPGTLRFGQVSSTPSRPPVGYDLIYVKTDDVLYIQDSSGVEVALGSASAITSLSGEATGTGPGNAVVTLSNSAVIGKVLTGFTPGPNSPVLATDTILQAFEKLQAQVSGTTGTAITALTGDVSATGPGSVPATVNFVGGKSASAIAQSVSDTQAATSSNTASTIVKRDASGNFSASVITANLSGNATTATTSTNFSGSLSGDVTGTQSATVVSLVGGKTAADVASATTTVDAATSTNTASTLVERDASGNFAANVITASLTGNVTGNVSGSSASFTGSLSGDVSGTQSATSVDKIKGTLVNSTAPTDAQFLVYQNGITAYKPVSLSADATMTDTGVVTLSTTAVTGKLLTGYVPGTNTPITASNSILTAFENLQAQVSSTTGAAITSLTGDITATGPGAAAASVVAIQGHSVSSTAPTDAQILIWNNGTSKWTPESISGDISITDLGVSSIVATTNSTITTLSALSLPGSQVTGNIPGNAANVTGVVAIVNGGTGQTTANAGFNALSPMTTLGDIIYEDATPKAVRLAGNITTTKQFLSQTGTGTISAAPSWTALVSSDIPNNAANTTGTASNITATSNSTLTTLTALSLPGSQVTGNISGNAGNVTGVVAINNGGTNNSSTYTAGSIIFSNGVSLTQDNANFYWDDTNHALGVGTIPSVTAVLDVVNNSGSTKAIQATGYGSNVGFRGRYANGTLSSPTAALTGNIISFISGRAYGTTGFAAASTGAINIIAGATFTDTSMPTYMSFNTTPTGSVTSVERMRINSTGNLLLDQTSDNGVDSLQIGSGLITGYAKLAGATSGNLQHTVPATVTTYTLSWPSAQGSSGTFLSNDGSGNLNWTNPVVNIDGGFAAAIYTSGQFISGGTA